jgi:dTDP-4-amino-4,6-dideoxygalactose transaminase
LRGSNKVKVKRYNYQQQFGEDIDRLMGDLRSMLLHGSYVLTEELVSFEREFARFLGVAHAYGTNTGTDAITLALKALRLGPGDEIITHANTFNATVSAIRITGATPVLVDADENSFQMNATQVAAAITSQTKVLLPAHLYGKPAPLAQLLAIADHWGLSVVEDAAQAHGARLGGRMVGSFGVAGCFSFHPSKNLAAAGDAGAVATSDVQLGERITMMRCLGQRNQNEHLLAGINSKMDAIQARILSWKLSCLEKWNAQRRVVAAWYRERLADLPLAFQSEDPNEEHVYHLFQVRTDSRDALLVHLQQSGVDAIVRYPTPIHLQPAFSDMGWTKGQFPVAEKLAGELLCLPIRPDLSLPEVDYVSECVHAFFRGQQHRSATAVAGR